MQHQGEKKQLQHFGLLVGGLFAVVGLWPMFLRAAGPRRWALALALVLVVSALAVPRSLARVYRAWMAAGEVLGWINSRVLLCLIFYGVVTPMGIMKRWLGRDPMRRGFEPGVETYRVPKPSRPGAHMTRQF